MKRPRSAVARRVERAAKRHPIAITAALIAVGTLVHRGMVLAEHVDALRALVAANPHWLLEQYLPIELLQRRPVAALTYLQQSPPIPNILLAILLQIGAWPGDVAVLFVVLQACVSAATAALLAVLIAKASRWWLGALLGTCFALNPDVLLLEYNAFGQQIYESLTMLWVLASIGCFWQSIETDRPAWSLGAGTFVALAALTRASYSLLFVPLLVAHWLSRASGRRIATFLLPIVLLHGGWAVKQWIVFGSPTLTTSSWGGGNLVVGLEEAGLGDELVAFVREHGYRYPEWFVAMHEGGLTSQWFNDPSYLAHVPEEWKAADREILRRLAPAEGSDDGIDGRIDNAVANTVSKARLYDLYSQLWRDYAIAHPDRIGRRTLRAYEVYWLPIRYHARQFLGLFSCDWSVSPRTRPWTLLAGLVDGTLPEPIERVAGTHPDVSRQRVALPLASIVSLLLWQANLWIVHLLVPLAVLWIAARHRLHPPHRETVLMTLALVYAYSAAVHNLVEYGENMRFRLTIEPVIWLLSSWSTWLMSGNIRNRIRSRT